MSNIINNIGKILIGIFLYLLLFFTLALPFLSFGCILFSPIFEVDLSNKITLVLVCFALGVINSKLVIVLDKFLFFHLFFRKKRFSYVDLEYISRILSILAAIIFLLIAIMCYEFSFGELTLILLSFFLGKFISNC